MVDLSSSSKTAPSDWPPSQDAARSPLTSSAADSVTSQAAVVDSEIALAVRKAASESTNRQDFLERLGAQMLSHFRAGLVAMDAAGIPGPVMLVADASLSGRIRGTELADRLRSASSLPVACDISASDIRTGDPRTADPRTGDLAAEAAGRDNGDPPVRGLRIELTPTPQRAAILVIYPAGAPPTAMDQFHDLRQLGFFAAAARDVLRNTHGNNQDNSHGNPDATDPIKASAGSTSETGLTVVRPSGLADLKSLRLFHRDLDLAATSYRIANESRRILGCDRTTILVRRSGRLRVQAVSGVSVVDRRANAVTTLQRLAAAAAVVARPLVMPGTDPLPPQIQEPMDEYLDQSGVMQAIALPLFDPSDDRGHKSTHRSDDVVDSIDLDPFSGDGEPIGMMVLEYFSGNVPATVDGPMRWVAGEATLALRNSIEHQQVFGLSIGKSVGRVVHSGRMPWVVGAIGLAVAMLIGSMLVKVQHHVIASGVAEPTMRREVFAAVDGVVKKIHVRDGQDVKAGDALFELENAELQTRSESLASEIRTAMKRLGSVQAVRLSGDTEQGQSSRLAMEEREIESELSNLRGQQAIIETQLAELIITSPIDGTIVGWQLERRLSNRPITRGSLIASIVDPGGPWSLRLQIPDSNAGPVLAAADRATARGDELPITFAVATLPEQSFTAALDSIATASRLDENGIHVIDADASITLAPDSFDALSMRSGADVTAKIACGERSVLRSWFSDVFDFVHRNVLFYF